MQAINQSGKAILPIPTMCNFLDTVEGNNIAAKYGLSSPEFQKAKADWCMKHGRSYPREFLDTIEGHSAAAKHGLSSAEFYIAKADWINRGRPGDDQPTRNHRIDNAKEVETVSDLTVIRHEDKLAMDSREVAKMVGKRHGDLMRDIRTYCEYMNAEANTTSAKSRSLDFFVDSTYQDGKGEVRPCFLCTKMGCELIANKLTGSKGIQFTAAYVARFNEMETGQNALSFTDMEALLTSPSTIIHIATQWKHEQEQRKALEAKVEQDKPKVLFADNVSASENDIFVGEMAKILKQSGVDTGEKRFFEQLRQDGYLINRKGSDRNLPTQRSMEMGLMRIKETTSSDPAGNIFTHRTTKITGKGQVYFANRYRRNASA